MRALPIPPESDLRRLYETERLTTYQVAEHFGASRPVVCRWLRKLGIPLRPGGRGLANRGSEPPTADELRVMVHTEHLTYAAIAERYGVHERAIHGWLDRAGIPRGEYRMTRYKGKPPRLPNATTLRRLYESGEGLEQIGHRYGVRWQLIHSLCKKFGIARRHDGFQNGRRWTCDDGHLVRSSFEQRVDNWLYAHGVEHTVDPRLPFNRRYCADFYANGMYVEVWCVKGSAQYDERKQRKCAEYAKHGARLIELNPYDFLPRAKNLWQRKLSVLLGGMPVQHELLLVA